jgi:hypothetical protein
MRGPVTLAHLRAVADAEGVRPTDADLERVAAILDGFLPALAELERLIPPDAEPFALPAR